jgi:hypothetical protein
MEIPSAKTQNPNNPKMIKPQYQDGFGDFDFPFHLELVWDLEIGIWNLRTT